MWVSNLKATDYIRNDSSLKRKSSMHIVQSRKVDIKVNLKHTIAKYMNK